MPTRALLPARAQRLAAGLGAFACAFAAIALGLVDALRAGLAQGGLRLDEMLVLLVASVGVALLSTRGAARTDAAAERAPAGRVFDADASRFLTLDTNACALAIGVDRFHHVRETLGYHVAGRLVRAVRERIQALAPDLPVRSLRGDAIGLLAPEAMVDELVALLQGMSARYLVDDITIDCPLTIGVAGPTSSDKVREAVEQAQFALDDALRQRRMRLDFDLSEQARLARNLQLMNDLQHAIATDALELRYQPKIDARSGEIDSFEALIRWPHPERGWVSPADFIPVAEKSGDVRALTAWVLNRARRDRATLDAKGVTQPIYVNIPAQLVGDARFADQLMATISAADGRIGIEVTETSVLTNPDRALTNLRRLAKAGVRIAIDDYGVGLSSLTYLKQMPATELKIDMSFIRDLTESHRDPLIVRSTIDLAHSLDLRVTAEGVDKLETLALLKVMGCDMLQGYQISPALRLSELISFVLERDGEAAVRAPSTDQLIALMSE